MGRGNIDILLITGGEFEIKYPVSALGNLLKILLNYTSNIYLITYYHEKCIVKLSRRKILSLRNEGNRFKKFISAQILTSRAILSIYRQNNIGTIIFAFGQDLQILPIILAKMVSKRIIIRSDGRPTQALRNYTKNYSLVKWCLFKVIEEISYRLADTVITECDYMILKYNFQKYKSQKGGNLFVDINKLINKTHLRNRVYEIGFVGRLSQEKGISNFLKALGLFNRDSNVIIIGDGRERENVLSEMQLLESKNKLNIEYTGWIENDILPEYLNEIKLLVVPSFVEGLPNIVLESMACGTVVLATPVGGIPGVIKDGETGFIMENNSPECIAENVRRALNHPNLEKIAGNARALVEREYTYEKAVERYRNILATLEQADRVRKVQ
ncbi:glycosyltransferase family 4 protein [Dehalococcoidia bacterium]|nr:glycosyltransferase family 4 protein [Dehalococcoidia bacterium]